MAKFSDLVGYITQEETVPGVWSQVEVPKAMKGDIIRQHVNHRDGSSVNDNVTLNHRVSLVGDRYAFANAHEIRWILFNGVKWEVTSVEIQRPRVIATLGGIWNG